MQTRAESEAAEALGVKDLLEQQHGSSLLASEFLRSAAFYTAVITICKECLASWPWCRD